MLGGQLCGAFAAPLFMPREKWVWIFDLVLICFGFTTCCLIPACIPLLIFWLKPEAKAWFNALPETVPEDAWGGE